MFKKKKEDSNILRDLKHDLMNPINAILGYSDYILEIVKFDISIIFIKDVNNIKDSVNNILKAVEKIFSYDESDNKNSFKNLVNNNSFQYSIRTPLSSIIGIIELLQDDEGLKEDVNYEELKLCLNHIKSSSYALLKILNKLKNISNVDMFLETYYTDVYLQDSSIRNINYTSKIQLLNKTGTILVVEDEIPNLDLIEKILLQYNHKVYKAKNALEAINILNENYLNIDLILLDLIMPEINGVDLLKIIKLDNKTFHLPVIIISAIDDMDAIVETISLGADDFLFKPINKTLLNARINNSLEKKYFHDKELKYQEEIKKEQDKADALLLNVLPLNIATRLKNGETMIADNIDSATVLFADIVGFTKLSANIDAKDILLMLNTIFSEFDELLTKYSLEKIKTIGDNYMVAGGVPLHSENHADSVVKIALEMLDIIPQIINPSKEPLQIKIGINSGPLSAGVIGKKKFIYDLWGDTVNVASRMEVFGEPNKIHLSSSTYEIVKNDYQFIKRNLLNIPGKGNMQTYYLESSNL